MTNVLLTGATGTLGAKIADHLLANPDVELRILTRHAASSEHLDALVGRGARVFTGSLQDRVTLDEATTGVDATISALQGGADVIVDGQLALAEAGRRAGVARFIPSDFAIDIYAAPQAPTLALRRGASQAFEDAGVDALHVLNGGFMDMMVSPGGGMVDLRDPQVNYWGTGNEPFDITTLDDTASFTARLAADPNATGGIYQISGSRTSMNGIADAIERRSGQSVPRHSAGSIDELRDQLATAGDPWDHVMLWYTLALFDTPPFETTANDRYPDLNLTTLDDLLDDYYEDRR